MLDVVFKSLLRMHLSLIGVLCWRHNCALCGLKFSIFVVSQFSFADSCI